MAKTDKKAPAFLFYASDWLGSARRMGMSLAERGAYIDLLAVQWGDPECSLPADEGKLARYVGASESEWAEIRHEVMACFDPHPVLEGRLANTRLYDVWTERQEMVEQRRNAGQRSAEARAQRDGERKGNGDGNGKSTRRQRDGERKGNSPSPSPSPLPSQSTNQDPPPAKDQPAGKQQSRDGTGDHPEPTAAAPPCLPAGLPACDLLRGSPWLGEIPDPDATLQRIRASYPRLDLDAVVAEAVGIAAEYGPAELSRLRDRGTTPERWLRHFAKNRDDDRHRREVELAEAKARGAAEGARSDDDRPPPVARLPSRGDGNLTASEKTIAASRRVIEKAREKDRRREAEAAEKAAGGAT